MTSQRESKEVKNGLFSFLASWQPDIGVRNHHFHYYSKEKKRFGKVIWSRNWAERAASLFASFKLLCILGSACFERGICRNMTPMKWKCEHLSSKTASSPLSSPQVCPVSLSCHHAGAPSTWRAALVCRSAACWPSGAGRATSWWAATRYTAASRKAKLSGATTCPSVKVRCFFCFVLFWFPKRNFLYTFFACSLFCFHCFFRS